MNPKKISHYTIVVILVMNGHEIIERKKFNSNGNNFRSILNITINPMGMDIR